MSQHSPIVSESLAAPSLERRVLLALVVAVAAAVAACKDGGRAQPPAVEATAPADGATEVAVDAAISVDFGRPMDPSTVNAANFGIACPDGTAIDGTVAYDRASHQAVFTPNAVLPGDTDCIATVTTGARSRVRPSL